MTVQDIERAAIAAEEKIRWHPEAAAAEITSACARMQMEEVAYFLMIVNLLWMTEAGYLPLESGTEMKNLARSRLKQFRDRINNLRSFYRSQIEGIEKQRRLRAELVDHIKSHSAEKTLETALALCDALTGENIYFQMARVIRDGGMTDEAFERAANAAARVADDPEDMTKRMWTIVRILNEEAGP